jgi:hypothetical protein
MPGLRQAGDEASGVSKLRQIPRQSSYQYGAKEKSREKSEEEIRKRKEPPPQGAALFFFFKFARLSLVAKKLKLCQAGTLQDQ